MLEWNLIPGAPMTLKSIADMALAGGAALLWRRKG